MFCSAQCPTAKGGGGICEFDCHPGELEAAHLQQATWADPRVPGYIREAGKQRAPRAASDQGRHAVRSTGTMWGPRAGGHGTFPHRRGTSKFNQERIAVGKMRYKDAPLLPLLQHVPLSACLSCADSIWSKLCFASRVINHWRALKSAFSAADYVQGKASLSAQSTGVLPVHGVWGWFCTIGWAQHARQDSPPLAQQTSFPPAFARQGLDLVLPLEPKL